MKAHMVLQHRAWREREQEKKILRMETHIQTRRFERTFATHALKILVLEAARYQRTFFEPKPESLPQTYRCTQAPDQQQQTSKILSFMMLHSFTPSTVPLQAGEKLWCRSSKIESFLSFSKGSA